MGTLLEGGAMAVLLAGRAATLMRCVLRGIRSREVVFTLARRSVRLVIWRTVVGAHWFAACMWPVLWGTIGGTDGGQDLGSISFL